MPGPTGDYPRGKLNEDDEGGLHIAIGDEKGLVILDFGTGVTWVGMPPDNARAFANLIIARANKVDKENKS